ncbi:replication-relaxation family protein [Streptomyces sp. NPDC058644]|uniref:replication-relaxation family protein n=1 Tax=unclassified Streptomyces TaxID=2593676 RepID=UPI00364A411D
MITNPRPQRSLRGHRPQRPGSRIAATGEHLARLAPRLTPRDRWLARLLLEHRVLTTHQITELAWPSERAANQRLLQLYKWRVLDRFQPFLPYGSAPMHYVLDVAGAAVLARQDGVEISALRYRHDHSIGVAHSLQLDHLVGTNGFFTALSAGARSRPGGGRLTAWWSEARCREHFGDIVLPDAYGRWREGPGELEWFLEYDSGSERPATRVGAKLPRYARLAERTGITTPVLLWTPSAQREARLRPALAAALQALADPASVPLATACAEPLPGAGPSPADARWLPLPARDCPQRRLRLNELPAAWPHLTPLPAAPNQEAASAPAHQILPPAGPGICNPPIDGQGG